MAAFNPVHRLAGPFCGVSSAVLPDHSTGGLPELHHAEGDGLAVELCAGITQTLSSAWKQVKSPNPGGATQNNDLNAVAATSATDAWAAGDYDTGTGTRTLALHWDGSAWTQATTPDLGGSTIDDSFTSVGATSASDVWAVGRYYNGSVDQTLAIHCC